MAVRLRDKVVRTMTLRQSWPRNFDEDLNQPKWQALLTDAPFPSNVQYGMPRSLDHSTPPVVEVYPPVYEGGWISRIMRVGTPVTIELEPLFSGLGPIEYVAVNLPVGALIVGDQLIGTPNTVTTFHNAQIAAVNADGRTNSPAVTWTILPALVPEPEYPPVYFSGWTAQTFTINVPVSIDLSVLFNGADPMTYAGVNLPPWASVTGSMITGTPDVTGTFADVKVTATNPDGSGTTPGVSWGVTATLAAPVYTGGWANRTFTVGVAFTIDLEDYFTGLDLLFAATGLPAWATRTNNMISGTPTIAGTTTGVTAGASNGAGSATTPAASWVCEAVPIPSSWTITVGFAPTGTYGYRKGSPGAILSSDVVAAGFTIDAIIAVSPTSVRYRVDDAAGNDVKVPGCDAVQVTFTDAAQSAISIVLPWNEANSRYESTNALNVFNYFVAHNGEMLVVTGLNTPYTVTALTITGAIPTTMKVGQSYNITVAATGGVAPLTFSLRGTWPDDHVIDSTTGETDVSPDTAGTYNGLSIRVTDSVGAFQDIVPAVNCVVSPAEPLAITAIPLTTAKVGVAWTGYTPTVTGGQTPYQYIKKPGTVWPTGSTVNINTGKAGGTITQDGTFPGLSIRVTDALGVIVDQDVFQLVVEPALGRCVGTVSGTNDPVLANTGYAIGDTLVLELVNTANLTLPTVTVDAANQWELWLSKAEGTNRAAAVYTLKATATNHAAVCQNASGLKTVKAWRGKKKGVIKITTFAGSTDIVYPEL